MKIALITGSGGLIGSEAVEFLSRKGFYIVGVDNDMRRYFFGREASTRWNVDRLRDSIAHYEHCNVDIRDSKKLERIFRKLSFDVSLIIHSAAQPSHDWAAR